MVGLHSAPISAKPGPTSGQADAWTGGLRVREVSRRPPLPAKPFPRPVQIAASAESFRFLQPRDETPRRNGPGRSYFFIFVELLLRHNTKTQAHHEREDCSRLSHCRVGQQRHSEVRVSCRTSFSARQVASPCRTQKGRRGSEKHLAGCASVAPGVAQVRVV